MDQIDAWLTPGSSSEETQETYRYFMRPEPHGDMGPIEVDQENGRRFRMMGVGMTRNAKEEDRSAKQVWLDPLPHIILDHAKAIQGWYGSKDDSGSARPRPCFSEAMLTEPYGGYCAVGCAFAVYYGQQVSTPEGFKRVETLKVGDVVWGRSPLGIVPSRITEVVKKSAPSGLRVELSNDQALHMTADHPIWNPTRGWVQVGTLVEGDEVEAYEEDLILRKVLRTEKGPMGKILHLALERAPPADDAGKRPRSPGAPSPLSLWVTYTIKVEEALRSLFSAASQSGPSGKHQREFVERPQTQRRDKGADARRLRTASGQPREGQAKECRVEAQTRRTSPGRHLWLQDLAAHALRALGWPQNNLQIGMGVADGSVLRPKWDRMGIRARGVADRVRHVLARLPIGRWPLHRGQGVLPVGTEGQDGEVQGRICNRGVGRGEAQGARHPTVTRISPLASSIVYDFQTSTENYYLSSPDCGKAPAILVHNCYVNSGMRGYRGSGIISVPKDYGAFVRKSLSKMNTSAAGYFSSFTDPFLPLETVYHNTQEGAQAFVDAGLPIFFLSRLSYPGWAIDQLKQSKYSYAQKSINTPSPADWKKLSPGALPLMDHLDEIRALRKAGIYVSIQCNPVVPGVVTHDQVEELFQMLGEAGANHIIVKFVEAGYSWAPTMTQGIYKRFGQDRGAAFAALFTQNIGGQKSIDEEYRMEGHRRYQKAATRHGMTYATCFEYKYQRDAEGEIVNKRGVSVGKQFLTADQCHGHRVPMHTRPGPGLPFQEVEECPPTGCLECATDNGGESRCGSELYGAAKALRMPDLKVPVKPWAGPPVVVETVPTPAPEGKPRLRLNATTGKFE